MRVGRFLTVALCLAAVAGKAGLAAEEATFFTTGEERYYHADSGCDAGRKWPISEEAALLFGKSACPICVKRTQPVYTGNCDFEWCHDVEMWAENSFEFEERLRIRETIPETFYEESRTTDASFDALYYEVFQPETGETAMSQPYPEDYAGRYVNAAGGMTYLLVDPTPESIDAFREKFGGGVWIVPAKYSYAELEEVRRDTVARVEEYLAAHPELDTRWVGHGLRLEENFIVEIAFYGPDSQTFIDSFDFPVCVRCKISDELTHTDEIILEEIPLKRVVMRQ